MDWIELILLKWPEKSEPGMYLLGRGAPFIDEEIEQKDWVKGEAYKVKGTFIYEETCTTGEANVISYLRTTH